MKVQQLNQIEGENYYQQSNHKAIIRTNTSTTLIIYNLQDTIRNHFIISDR